MTSFSVARALGNALVGGAATEVLPVGLQAGGALGGVLRLVLGGLLSLCRSIELVAHVGKLFLSLLELELKVVVGGFFTGAFVGLACVDLSGYDAKAEFDYFDYRELPDNR